ncbi:MAG TPA: VIT domain-containing protein [Kofleriaceae bacterium]|nr:VIT domain-containing protein [Kofleriaceae bacterium]
MSRARLIAVLAASITAAGASTLACNASNADTGKPPPIAGRPAPGQPPPVTAAPGAPIRVTPVTNLFVATSGPVSRETPAPWSLTASDGSGLQLTRVDAKAVVEGPLAFTELHLYFHNPEARIREGTFAITLPQGAAVSRFAMESNGQLLEAEVVEKQRARIAYEDFLHRRQDPALLEKAEGNQFSARVFPIPANADKHLVISFSQEVSPGHYTLPLRGLAKSDRIDVQVQVRGQTGAVAEQTLSERNWKPDRDVVVDGTKVGAPRAIGAGELAATRVVVELPNAAEVPASVTLLVDTSASRALGFAAEARTIHQLVDQLARDYGGALPVQVVAFDQVTAPIYDGRADKIGNIEQALVARGALGASDLGQALAWVAAHSPRARLVVITDGVVTAGAETAALPALAKQLAGRGVDRIDVALSGGIRDDQAAAAVAHAGLAHTGAILDLDQGVTEVARRIGLAVRTELPIAVDGARWVFPRSIAAAQSGDEVTVYTRRPAQGPLAITVAGVRTVASPVAVMPTLLGRAFAGAEITELDGQLAKQTGDAATKLRAEIVRRSVAARVVSSQTSLLVLESDADYARFGIDRRSLSEILAIGPTGVELMHRAAPPAPAQIAEPVAAKPMPPRKQPATKSLAAADSAAGDDDDDDKPSASSPRRAFKMAKKADSSDRDDDERPKAGMAAPRGAAGPRVAAAEAEPQEELESADVARNTRRRPFVDGRGPAPAAPPPPPPPPPSVTRPSPEPRPAAAPMIASVSRPDADDVSGSDSNDDGLAMNRRKPALHGPLAEIEHELATGGADAALVKAWAWHNRAPGDVLGLIGLGDALEAKHNLDTAARVYGSIIDLYPARADFRRFAGERLERLGKAQRALIIDTYKRAVDERPDHLTGHRMLAYALLRDGQYAAAFTAILAGIDQQYPENRFAGAERVLSDDVGMIGAAYLAHVAGKRDEVLAQLGKRRIPLPTQPSTRFIMYWETDDNDVDFHIRDARGGHAWYSHKQLASGGELYADITTGYGPECFAIPGTPKAGPYQLAINYYSQGPMGYGMGLLQIQKFDGQGNLSFEDRPYVIMTDQAFVDLGTFK